MKQVTSSILSPVIILSARLGSKHSLINYLLTIHACMLIFALVRADGHDFALLCVDLIPFKLALSTNLLVES